MPVPTKDEPAGFSLPSVLLPRWECWRPISLSTCSFYSLLQGCWEWVHDTQLRVMLLLSSGTSFVWGRQTADASVTSFRNSLYFLPCRSHLPSALLLRSKCNLDIFQRPNKGFLPFPLTFQCPIQNWTKTTQQVGRVPATT